MRDDSATVLIDTDELAEMIAALPEPRRGCVAALQLGHVSINVAYPWMGRLNGPHNLAPRRYNIVCKGVVIMQYFGGTALEAAQIVNVAAAAADHVQTGATVHGAQRLIMRLGYEEALRRMRRDDAARTLMLNRTHCLCCCEI